MTFYAVVELLRDLITASRGKIRNTEIPWIFLDNPARPILMREEVIFFNNAKRSY